MNELFYNNQKIQQGCFSLISGFHCTAPEEFNPDIYIYFFLSSYNSLQLAHSLKIHQYTNSTKLNSSINYSPLRKIKHTMIVKARCQSKF